MSNNPRYAILSIAAVVGVQIPGLVINATAPAQSTSCLQWASEAVNVTGERLQRTFNPPHVPDGMEEGEYNQLREVFHTNDIRLSDPRTAANQSAPIASVSNSPQATPIESSVLPNGLTQEESDQRRRAMRDGGY